MAADCPRCAITDRQIAAALAMTHKEIATAKTLECAQILGQIASLLETLR